MLDPIELLTETIIPVLRSVPTLVACVGDDADRIYAYVHSYPTSVEPLFAVLSRQEPGSILVAHRMTVVGGGRGNGIEHTYSCCLKPIGNIGPMFLALRDGTPALVRTAPGEDGLTAGPGSKLKIGQIHYKCLPPQLLSLSSQTITISEQQYIDYYDAPLALAERGIDN